jgi:AcrR family transcriptional regulator
MVGFVTTVSPDPQLRVSLSPRAAEIASAARDLLEAEGIAALSMRNIAAQLGIRAASLYEHFSDKRAVENAIIASGLYDQGDYIATSLAASSGEPIAAIATAFREYALAHPALYKLIMSRGLDRCAPDVAAAELHAGAPIREQVGEHREFSLSLWAFSHGMVDLELSDRFPPGFDIDAVWASGIQALVDGLDTRRSAA